MGLGRAVWLGPLGVRQATPRGPCGQWLRRGAILATAAGHLSAARAAMACICRMAIGPRGGVAEAVQLDQENAHNKDSGLIVGRNWARGYAIEPIVVARPWMTD